MLIAPSAMRQFVTEVFVAAGTSSDHAATMARLLVEQDMAQSDGHPGSHGTRTMTDFHSEGRSPGWQNYVRSMLPDPPAGYTPYGANAGTGTGRVNPRPKVSVLSQSPTLRVYDGDGGLGHICAVEATQWASEWPAAAARTRVLIVHRVESVQQFIARLCDVRPPISAL